MKSVTNRRCASPYLCLLSGILRWDLKVLFPIIRGWPVTTSRQSQFSLLTHRGGSEATNFRVVVLSLSASVSVIVAYGRFIGLNLREMCTVPYTQRSSVVEVVSLENPLELMRTLGMKRVFRVSIWVSYIVLYRPAHKHRLDKIFVDGGISESMFVRWWRDRQLGAADFSRAR